MQNDNGKVSCICNNNEIRSSNGYRKTDQKCNCNLESSCGLIQLISRFLKCNNTETRREKMEF